MQLGTKLTKDKAERLIGLLVQHFTGISVNRAFGKLIVGQRYNNPFPQPYQKLYLNIF